MKKAPIHTTTLKKGIYLRRQREFASAAKSFYSLLRLQPKQYGVWLQYIESLILSEMHEAAKVAMHQCHSLGFETPELNALAAKIGMPPNHREQSLIDLYQQNGPVEIAARMFISHYPNWPLGWDILGSYFHREGDFEQALQIRKDAATRFPDNVDLQVKIALSLQELKQFDEAEAVMHKAFDQAPTRIELLAHAGYLRQLQGNLQGAEEIYRQCVSRKPENAAMHSNLGELLLDFGCIDEAALEIKKAIELDPNLAEAHCNFGHLEVRLGNLESAIAAYERSVVINPALTEAIDALVKLKSE